MVCGPCCQCSGKLLSPGCSSWSRLVSIYQPAPSAVPRPSLQTERIVVNFWNSRPHSLLHILHGHIMSGHSEYQCHLYWPKKFRLGHNNFMILGSKPTIMHQVYLWYAFTLVLHTKYMEYFIIANNTCARPIGWSLGKNLVYHIKIKCPYLNI